MLNSHLLLPDLRPGLLSWAKSFRLLSIGFSLCSLAFAAWGQEFPSLQRVVGSVSTSGDGKISPSNGASIIFVDSSGKELASSLVESGAYGSAVLILTAAYYDKPIGIRYRAADNTLYLAYADTSGQKTFPFKGAAFPATPTNTTVNVVLSSTILKAGSSTTEEGSNNGSTQPSTGTGTGTGTTTPATAVGDANKDGVVDELDVVIFRAALVGQQAIVMTTMDLTQDGVFNSRDLIVLLQRIRASRKSAATSAAANNTSTTTAAGSPIVNAVKASKAN